MKMISKREIELINEARARHQGKPDIVIVNSLKKNWGYSDETAWEIVNEFRARFLNPREDDSEYIVTLRDFLIGSQAEKATAAKFYVVLGDISASYIAESQEEAQRIIALLKGLSPDIEIYVKSS